MKIYLFNPETGIYLGEDFADEAPMKRGGYVIPPDATTIAPPAIERGQILVFNFKEERWEVHPAGDFTNNLYANVTHCDDRFADRF